MRNWQKLYVAGTFHRAVEAARRAFDHGPWPGTTPDERADVLRRVVTPSAAAGV